MITKRTLENYRSLALKYQHHSTAKAVMNQSPESISQDIQKLCRIVLSITQELLDQHLLRR